MTAGILPGIGFGLGTALCQSVFYLFTRRFVGRTGKTPMLLLIVSHVLMGVASAALLLVLWPRHLPPLDVYIVPLACAALAYLAAQLGLFSVLRDVESSRVAPLLGGKIIVLAVLTMLILHQELHPVQWLAVGVSAGATWMLNETGGRIPLRSLAILALTILGYCLSDMSIGVLVKRLAGCEPSAPLVGAALTYLLCGALTLPFAFRPETHDRRVWILAIPCAASWFTAMCLLYACFGLIGVVFGNIVQASRGMLSVVLGWAVARIGQTQIEAHVPRPIFWRRIAGAALMLLAVTLYLWH